MKKIIIITLQVATLFALLSLTGCAGSSSTYYRSYHDPYQNWGRTNIYIRNDRHHGSKPPMHKPPGHRPPNMGRPPHRPSKPSHRPSKPSHRPSKPRRK